MSFYHLGMLNYTFVPCIDYKRNKIRKTLKTGVAVEHGYIKF